MSQNASVSTPRFGNLGIFSVGVLAFALVALQGCAPTVTASSAKEPGGFVPGLGALRGDPPPRVERVSRARERVDFDSTARDRATRSLRVDSECWRCGR